MINKYRTIHKAEAKYKRIMPIPGKRSLEDCFFCLRGRSFFQFRTREDRKVHTMRACMVQPEAATFRIDREALARIYQFVTKPILVRSLIFKHA